MQVADHQRHFVIDALRAPMQCVDARQQLAEGKGLGQIVIAAAAQAAYPIVDFRQCAQYQDRGALAGLAQHLDDGESVDISRQHPVHDDDIIRLAGSQEHAVAPIAGMIRGVSGFLQAFDDELCDPLVVLDQQDLHEWSPSGDPAVSAGSSASALAARFFWRRPLIRMLNSSKYR